jgi:predicted transcriptional regulator
MAIRRSAKLSPNRLMQQNAVYNEELCMSNQGLTLSRREREIMDVVYALGEATANEIQARLADPPANAAVRNQLRILEEKGHLTHRKDGKRFVYRPSRSKLRSGRSALGRVIQVYFEDSLPKALSAHLADPSSTISEEELDALDKLVKEAKRKRRGES